VTAGRSACRVDRLPQSGPLYYVCEQGTGITRERTAEGFVYRGPSGRTVRDKATLERIRRLAVPPAWQDVWICADAHGHLQATGRDSKGRKQYKYHEAWRELRDAGKFERMAAFGRALPGIRRQAETDLSRTDLSKATVLGLVVLLLDETLLRIGNEEYARQNEAFGLTTLRDRHACVCGPEVRLVFRGKGGKQQAASIHDRRLAQTVKRTQELPGDILFQYLDADGEPEPITSGDVNDYLRDVTGREFTAKDFRTWGGTLVAARELAGSGPTPRGKREQVSRVSKALDSAAAHLGNTRAVARRSYVHPDVIASFLDGTLHEAWARGSAEAPPADYGALTPDEQALLSTLDEIDAALKPAEPIH
jgi:DNA topoisomerase I